MSTTAAVVPLQRPQQQQQCDFGRGGGEITKPSLEDCPSPLLHRCCMDVGMLSAMISYLPLPTEDSTASAAVPLFQEYSRRSWEANSWRICPTQTSGGAAAIAGATTTPTLPLALLAANPICRILLEERRGGCVLSPAGALTLSVQLRRQDIPSTVVSGGHRASQCRNTRDTFDSAEKGQPQHPKGGGGGRKPRGRRGTSDASTAAMRDSVWVLSPILVVVSKNISSHWTPRPPAPSSHAPAPGPLREHLTKPPAAYTVVRRSSVSSPPPPSTPRERLASPEQPGGLRRAPTAGVVGRSPVQQSLRLPIVPRTPPLLQLQKSDSPGRFLRTITAEPPPGPPPFNSTAPSSLPELRMDAPVLPVSLQLLRNALWWIRRRTLPLSLSLLQYSHEEQRFISELLDAPIKTPRGRLATGSVSRCDRALESLPHQSSSSSSSPTSSVPSEVVDNASVDAGQPLLDEGLDKPVLIRHDGRQVLPLTMPFSPVTPMKQLAPNVTELYLRGRVAEKALATLLHRHPEVNAISLQNTNLSDAQLQLMPRYCRGMTQLSLAMNTQIQSTKFLCPTPSDTSSMSYLTSGTAVAPPAQSVLHHSAVRQPTHRPSKDDLSAPSLSAPGLAHGHSSQLDLFGPEEDGDVEMRYSLWQASQADDSERRQPVVILRPQDVELGDAEPKQCSPTASPPPDFDLFQPLVRDRAASVRSHTDPMQQSTATEAVSSPLSPFMSPPATSSAAENGVRRQSVDESMGAELLSRRKDGIPSPNQHRNGLTIPRPLAAAEAERRMTRQSAPPLSYRSGGHSHTRRRHRLKRKPATYWSHSLLDLNLAYTGVHDEDAARDLPRLTRLCRLSLEGCIHITRLGWLPQLASLRELDLSTTAVCGSQLCKLRGCALLEVLILDGCMGLTSILQILTSIPPEEEVTPAAEEENVGDDDNHQDGDGGNDADEVTSLAAAASSTSSFPSTLSTPTPMSPLRNRIVRHVVQGGIAAFTVLPPFLSLTERARRRQQRQQQRRRRHHRRSGAASQAASAELATRRSRTAAAAAEAREAPLARTLRVLIVGHTGLTDVGLQGILYCRQLECLVLAGCSAITNVNITASLPWLRQLDVSSTAVTTDGLSELGRSATLLHLLLRDCLQLTRLPPLLTCTSDRAAMDAVLRERRQTVGYPGPYGEGHEGQYDSAEPLGHFELPGLPLVSLDLTNCRQLTANSIAELVQGDIFLRSREATASDSPTPAPTPTPPPVVMNPAVYCCVPTVARLSLRSCEKVTQLRAIRTLQCVVELDLYHVRITEQVLAEAVASWCCLEVLNVASTAVSSLSMWQPRNYPASDDGAGAAVDGALPSFAQTLRVLNLSNTEVRSTGLQALRWFPKLETLQLTDCSHIDDLSFLVLATEDGTIGGDTSLAGATAVPRRSRLRELTITAAAKLTNEHAVPYLACCTALEKLSLSNCVLLGSGAGGGAAAKRGPAVLAPLAALHHMRDANFSSTAITLEDLQQLAPPVTNQRSGAVLETTHGAPPGVAGWTLLEQLRLRGCRRLQCNGAAAVRTLAEDCDGGVEEVTRVLSLFPALQETLLDAAVSHLRHS